MTRKISRKLIRMMSQESNVPTLSKTIGRSESNPDKIRRNQIAPFVSQTPDLLLSVQKRESGRTSKVASVDGMAKDGRPPLPRTFTMREVQSGGI